MSKPQLFDVMPAGELQRALKQSLPAGTTVVWHPLGVFAVTAGKLGMVDAGSLHPGHPGEIYTLDWPHPQAEVWLQLAVLPGGKVDRVYAVLLSVPGQGLAQQAGNWDVVEGSSMAIDSATAAFGDYGRMLSEMRGGGPMSQTCLGRGGSVKEPAAMQAREGAANLLIQHGYPAKVERWERTGGLSVSFSPGLTDEQLAAANALLKQAGFQDEVWLAGSHTSGQLEEELIKKPFTHLADQRGPYLFACKTGFGDGIYYWDGLCRSGQLCGYLCNFVPADEAEADDDEVLDAEIIAAEVVQPKVPQRVTSPQTHAPPTTPGVLVAVRISPLLHWLARVEQQTPTGWNVLYPSGERAQVPASNVIPIPNQAVFQVGDEVLALWNPPHMFPGRITAISQQGYTVAWLDGDAPRVVALGTLTFLSWT